MDGIIHSFESLAAVDGEGLRYSVFLAGCPIRCAYCHNPDTWEMMGKKITPEELVKKIGRYKVYFGYNGGVTFSGGEPLLQAQFLKSCVPLLSDAKIPYVLDTSGQVELTEDVQFLLRNAQEVLLDLKFPSNDDYLTYTGGSLNKTLSMLSYLDEIGKPTVLRTVIVQGINDSTDYLDLYLEKIREFTCIKKYELLPFHTMGFFKYEKLGIKNPFAEKTAFAKEKLTELQLYVNNKIKKEG